MSKREWFYRKIFTRNTTGHAICLISLSLLACVCMMEPSGKYSKLLKPVWKLPNRFGPKLWELIDKMSIHRLEPDFKVGDLVHLEGFELTSVFAGVSTGIKIGLIISGPTYDKSYTYQDWEIIDEPMYDVQFGSKIRKSIPQRFLTRIKKEESSNSNSKH